MTTPRWLKYFGLDRPPFTKEVGDDELWLPSSGKAVVEEILDAARDHLHVLLVGEPASPAMATPAAVTTTRWSGRLNRGRAGYDERSC